MLGKPNDAGRDLNGGPQMLQLSYDGSRLYVTNSLYSTWDNQFYPDMRSWLLKVDCHPEGGMTVDPSFFVDFHDRPGGPGPRPRGAAPKRRLHHGDLPVGLREHAAMLSIHPPREHSWTVAAAGLPAAVPLAIALAWAAALAAQATGHSSLLHGHEHAQEHGLPLWLIVLLPPFWLTVAGFLLAWLVMVAAMMLPANLPTIRRFAAATADHPRPRRAMAAFLAGHAFTWSAFAGLAYLADTAIHQTFGSTSPWLLSAGVLATAGVFQFTALKRTCLAHRRHLDAHLLQERSGRAAAAFRLGRLHGLSCVGCCGPLMLLMLTVRAAPLLLMAALTALMLCETIPRLARTATPVIGVALLLAAALLLAHPTWVPQALS